jgi:hypothetical protein
MRRPLLDEGDVEAGAHEVRPMPARRARADDGDLLALDADAFPGPRRSDSERMRFV